MRYVLAHLIMGMKHPQVEIPAIALHVWEKWVKTFRFPGAICSELGPAFEMDLFTALSQIAGVHKVFEHHPNLHLPEKFHQLVASLIDRYGLWQAPHPTMFLSSKLLRLQHQTPWQDEGVSFPSFLWAHSNHSG